MANGRSMYDKFKRQLWKHCSYPIRGQPPDSVGQLPFSVAWAFTSIAGSYRFGGDGQRLPAKSTVCEN